jgi:hypothetical protein
MDGFLAGVCAMSAFAVLLVFVHWLGFLTEAIEDRGRGEAGVKAWTAFWLLVILCTVVKCTQPALERDVARNHPAIATAQ